MKEGHIVESGGRSSLFHISPSSRVVHFLHKQFRGRSLCLCTPADCLLQIRPTSKASICHFSGISFIWKDAKVSAMVHVRGQTAS